MEFVYLGMVKRNTPSTCISLLIKKFLSDVDVKPSNAPWFKKRLALIFSLRSLIKEWKKLFGDTVSPNNSLFGGTVSPNYLLFGDKVSPTYMFISFI